MAISIISTPQLIQTAYNPIYFKVSSDNTSKEAFNFIFDIYVDGQFINRDRLLPRPGTTQAIYSPARILESYLSYDLTQNITGETSSTNSIIDYELVIGEEYITPWRFYSNRAVTGGTYNGYTQFYSTGATNPFVSGDTIYVTQDAGFSTYLYNGFFTVLSATSSSIVVDTIHSVNTGINGGTAVYSDNRKTIYTGTTQILNNPTMIYSGGNWSSYGPDGCSVNLGLTVANKLTFVIPDVGCGTNTQISYNSYSGFVTGAPYIVYTTVSDINNPSGNDQSVTPVLGGNYGTPIVGTGTTAQIIVCGTGNTFGLEFYMDADTGGFGSHSESVSNCHIDTYNTYSAYTFNGVLQYEEIPLWDYTQFKMTTGNTGQFLTNMPNPIKARLEDRGSIGWMSIQDYNPAYQYFMVIGTNYEVGPGFPLIIPLSAMTHNGFTGNTDDLILNFPAYPVNLNELSQSLYAIDVIIESVLNYTLQIFVLTDPIGDPDNYIPVSDKQTFINDDECTKYEPIRFQFLNRLGSFDYFTSLLVSRKTVNITRNTYQKTLAYNYTQGDRGKTVISVDAQETYLATSSWVNNETSAWLEELWTSPEVYILDNVTGAITPIVIDTNSIEIKKTVNDKMISYDFAYSKAVPLNIQRG